MRLIGRVELRDGVPTAVHPFLEDGPHFGPVAAEVGAWVEVEDGAERVLAHADTARAALLALAARYQLDPLFTEAELEQTRAILAAPGLDDPTLEDLRHLPLCTIDELTSKDLDQALFVEQSAEGFVVWYAIADAAWFVPPCTPLFKRALAQGASYYLPGLVLPMLPRALSEDLISLNPQVDRRAMVFRLSLDAEGESTGTTLHRALVRSRSKLHFDGVQAWYDGGAPPCADPQVLTSLSALEAVGKLRLGREVRQHVVRYRRAEVELSLGGLGLVALSDLRNDVERYNEQISLLANAEGARLLLAGRRPELRPVFRVHEAPARARLYELRERISALVLLHQLDPARWAWEPGQALSDYLRQLPDDGPFAGVARAIHRHALLTNQRSYFQAEPGAHYGVGAPLYSRFTAPMREVVGVYVHEEAWEAVGLSPSRVPEGLREQVMEAGNRSREVQKRLDRETNRMVLDQLLTHSAGPLSGTIMGLTRTKIHVTLDSPPLDVKIYRFDQENYMGRPLVLAPDEVSLRDRRGDAVMWRVGDTVRVRALGRNLERDRWQVVMER